MKIFIDTEFHEYKKKGINTIELVSLALVKDTGEKLYLISNEFDLRAAWNNTWLKDNVLKLLPLKDQTIKSRTDLTKYVNKEGVSIERIKELVLEFVGNAKPEFWGYYCGCDWVVFCWIFGRMTDLPNNFPIYCCDLKQVLDTFGVKQENVNLIKEKYKLHNALEDAGFNKELWEFINNDCKHVN